MANKFLGALGLDVIVDKIKELFTKLDTKLDDNGILTLYPTSADWVMPDNLLEKYLNDNNTKPTMIRWVGIAAGDDSFVYTGDVNDVTTVYTDGRSYAYIHFGGILYTLMGVMVLANPCVIGSINELTPMFYMEQSRVRYTAGKLQVFEGDKWVDYMPSSTGVDVEEMTAEEVAAKFE